MACPSKTSRGSSPLGVASPRTQSSRSDDAISIAELQVQALQNAAGSLGVMLQIQNVRTGDDLPAAFERTAKEHAEGLITTQESTFAVFGAQVADPAAHHRLPAGYGNSLIVTDRGGLMAYAPDTTDLYRRAASYAVRILTDAKPADLPVRQPTKFEFVINLKAAKMLGLKLPPGLADPWVIE